MSRLFHAVRFPALATRLTAALAVTLAIAGPGGAILINNGLAPPNPANVIDANNSYPSDAVFVRNVGCRLRSK